MNIVDIITKKRDGLPLSQDEIEWTIKQYCGGSLPDYQMSSLLMSVYFQGMSREETQNLTQAMIDSGDRIDLSSIPYYNFVTGELAGIKEVIISNSGYTGAGGFELYMHNEDGDQVWNRLFEAGNGMALGPSGLASRDTLRLEMGYCLYGNDIDETTSPLEAGLAWITKFTEGNNFINRTFLEQQKARGLEKRLVGFKLLERGIPRQHYPILDLEGTTIGEVTSGTMSPILNIGIGMGYVNSQYASKDTEIRIGIRNKQIPAVVVKPPFYNPPD